MWNVKRARYTRVSGCSVKSGKKQRLGSSLPGINCSGVPVLELGLHPKWQQYLLE